MSLLSQGESEGSDLVAQAEPDEQADEVSFDDGCPTTSSAPISQRMVTRVSGAAPIGSAMVNEL
jgi:hypothetical protein